MKSPCPQSKDQLTSALSSAFTDEDARRGPHYSRFISKLEAIELAALAISRGDAYPDGVVYEFCDREGLYGQARVEVWWRVFEEYSWISEFIYGP